MRIAHYDTHQRHVRSGFCTGDISTALLTQRHDTQSPATLLASLPSTHSQHHERTTAGEPDTAYSPNLDIDDTAESNVLPPQHCVLEDSDWDLQGRIATAESPLNPKQVSNESMIDRIVILAPGFLRREVTQVA